MPAHSTLDVEIQPETGVDLSLYGYQSAAGRKPTLPPNGASSMCEASALHGERSIRVKSNPGKREKIKLIATTNPYTVVIGVAGAYNIDKGGFTLSAKLKVRGAGVPNTGPPPIKLVRAKHNQTTTIRGDIRGGKIIPLDWASRSGTACWPATRNVHYNGNHVLYRLEMPPYSEMKVELKPKPGVDLSLYGYQTGRRVTLPPNGASHLCEASALHGVRNIRTTANPGQPERIKLVALKNPYTVIIGVAGAQKARAGAFELKIDLAVRKQTIARHDTAAGEDDPNQARDNGYVRSHRSGTRDSFEMGQYIPGGLLASNAQCPLQWPPCSLPIRYAPQSKLEVELTPKHNADLSIYGYQSGLGRDPVLPPKGAASTCEASALYGIRKRSITTNPGGKEVIKLMSVRNPYTVIIGVAGAHKTQKGAFDIKFNLKPR